MLLASEIKTKKAAAWGYPRMKIGWWQAPAPFFSNSRVDKKKRGIRRIDLTKRKRMIAHNPVVFLSRRHYTVKLTL